MFKRIHGLIAILALCLAAPAHAQWAVVDAPAIVQLIQEVDTLEQMLRTARAQLTQANQALQTMTGARGMQSLLSGTQRNYLPMSWTQLIGAMQGTGGYAALSSDIRGAIADNALLTPPQLAAFSAADQRLLLARRQASALRQALTQEALANASGRFASLQTLIGAISTAGDQKGILDLQARISAELGMLQNEQTKLLILHQATEAQEAVNRQQEREQGIADRGNFASRFQPVL